MRSFWQRAAAGCLVFAGFAVFPLRAAAASGQFEPIELAKFTGILSCQSSSCHGGGMEKDQCTTWASLDFHARAQAILLTPRAQAITGSLKSTAPMANVRCTVCHAPEAGVPASRLVPKGHADEGVSCEACHGPASEWLRSHTRTDYTYAQRIASGMNDLRSLYQRANTCVACHEYLDADLTKAGHPPLVFELDSQTVSEPPHWKDTDPWIGLHSWLTGQAVAYREQTWHILKYPMGEPGAAARWEALGWLLRETGAELKGLPSSPESVGDMTGTMTANQLAAAEKCGDRLARSAATYPWTPRAARDLLHHLAATKDLRSVEQAEVLAQALDRLLVALNHQGVTIPNAGAKLDAIFADVRRPEDFDAARFRRDLEDFSRLLGKS